MNFDYESLLKKAMEKIPKNKENKKRFQIPQINSQIEGNKTSIRNFLEISSKIRRNPSQLSKYFAKEFAVPVSIKGNTLILQKKNSRETLQNKFEDYIKNFVYCKVCNEPDTILDKEDRILFIKCDACGAKTATKKI